MEAKTDQKELQLLPSPPLKCLPQQPAVSDHHQCGVVAPSLDLQLSISVTPIAAAVTDRMCDQGEGKSVEALRWQAAEQIRLAAIEKAYAERVRELTRREMELAQSEFARARNLWERAKEEVEKAERLKEQATRQIDSACLEITCHSCRQTFKPS